MDLSIGRTALGVFLAPGGPARIVETHREDEDLLRVGDILRSIDGRPTPDAATVTAVTRSYPAGTWVDVGVERDGTLLSVRVALVVMYQGPRGVYYDLLLR